MRPIHYAEWRHDGPVSLCRSTERPRLTWREPWTSQRLKVTCRECLDILREQDARAEDGSAVSSAPLP